MKNNILVLFAILYMVLESCSDIKFEVPLPHNAAVQHELPDDLLGKYEIVDKAALKTNYFLVQLSDQKWGMQQQHSIAVSAIDNLRYRVEHDSLYEKSDDDWQFIESCEREGGQYWLDDLTTIYTADTKNHTFRIKEDEHGPKPLEIRKQNGNYYFNVKESGILLYVLMPTPKGIRLCYTNSLKVHATALPFPAKPVITHITGSTPDTSYIANPTNHQLALLLRDTALFEFVDMIRLSDVE